MKLDEEGQSSFPKLFCSLPPELISHIVSFLTFHEIAHCRQVCRLFNQTGKKLLNTEAQRILQIVSAFISKEERKPNRRLSRWPIDPTTDKCRDWTVILKTIRFLYRTYKPYIDDRSSCFVAGKILDLTNTLLKLDKIQYSKFSALGYLEGKALRHFNEIIIPRMHAPAPRPTFALLPDWVVGLLPTANDMYENMFAETFNQIEESQADDDEEQTIITEKLSQKIVDLENRNANLEKRNALLVKRVKQLEYYLK